MKRGGFMRRLIRLIIPTTLIVLTLAAPALGGGVTVVNFAQVPPDFEAGTPYRLDYSILGHGVEPMEVGNSTLRFHGPGGETITFPADSTAKGQWTAEVTLPSAGEWRWEVLAGSEVLQTLGTLSVAPTPEAIPAGLLDSLRVGLPIATLLALILLVTEIRSRSRRERQPAPVADVA
jgi:hypothetical protein